MTASGLQLLLLRFPPLYVTFARVYHSLVCTILLYPATSLDDGATILSRWQLVTIALGAEDAAPCLEQWPIGQGGARAVGARR
jgi:hypothetical protein